MSIKRLQPTKARGRISKSREGRPRLAAEALIVRRQARPTYCSGQMAR
jgi:hypothetical protein